MGSYMVGTALFAFVSILPLGGWAMYVLSSEGWISSRGSVEKILRVILWIGIAYQILLPFYWNLILSPQGLANAMTL